MPGYHFAGRREERAGVVGWLCGISQLPSITYAVTASATKADRVSEARIALSDQADLGFGGQRGSSEKLVFFGETR